MKIAALTIGINYIGQQTQLRGCINDSNNFSAYVRGVLGDRLLTHVQMVDTLPANHALYPTKANIEKALTGLVQETWDGKYTHVMFHYSGHGARQWDTNGDEQDQIDETLVPVDYHTAGFITDDWLFEFVVNAMPPDVRFFGLMDACHSGTVWDLRYRVDEGNPPANVLVNPQSSETVTAMMISGCKDAQLSYDVWDKKHGAVGAMTNAWLGEMRKQRGGSVVGILRGMRAELRRQGYPQTPELSSSKKLTGTHKIYGIGEY